MTYLFIYLLSFAMLWMDQFKLVFQLCCKASLNFCRNCFRASSSVKCGTRVSYEKQKIIIKTKTTTAVAQSTAAVTTSHAGPVDTWCPWWWISLVFTYLYILDILDCGYLGYWPTCRYLMSLMVDISGIHLPVDTWCPWWWIFRVFTYL